MMKMDIRARVLLAALIPVTVIALLLTSFFVTVRFNDLEETWTLRGQSAAASLAIAAEYGVFSGNREALQSLADASLNQSKLLSVLITGQEGEVLARSGHPRTWRLDGTPPDKGEAADGALSFSAPIVSAPIPMDDLLSVQGPRNMNAVQGRVIVEIDHQDVLQQKTELLATSLSIALLVALGGTLLAMHLSQSVSQPVDEIADAVSLISQGHFDVRTSTSVGGSLQMLSDRINEMSRQLADSQREMQRRIEKATDELRLRKEEAERANLAKSRFLAAASHDLRQPMHALGLFVGQLQSVRLAPEASHLVGRVSESVRALEGLLDGLLDISKLDAKVLSPSIASFPVARIFERLETDFGGPAREKGLYLRVRPSSLWVSTDPLLLERILLNLVGNALRYTDEGGILVACRRRGKRIRIEVRDSGIGIPRNAQEAVFQEFVQLHNPGRDRSMGLGLGLAIVKRLAALLKLPLQLRSTPGEGSLFVVEVPLAQAQPMEACPPIANASLSPALQGKTVAVVDDDALVLASMEGLLEAWGCVVVPAESPAMVLERISRIGLVPDVLLCDYRLKGPVDGLAGIREVRAHFGQGLPAALVSGDTDPEVLRRARKCGVELLHKPVSPNNLYALLERLLRQTGGDPSGP